MDERLLEALRVRIGQSYDTWFRPGQAHLRIVDDSLIVDVPNVFFRDWLARSFAGDLFAVARAVLGARAKVAFNVDPSVFAAAPVVAPASAPVPEALRIAEPEVAQAPHQAPSAIEADDLRNPQLRMPADWWQLDPRGRDVESCWLTPGVGIACRFVSDMIGAWHHWVQQNGKQRPVPCFGPPHCKLCVEHNQQRALCGRAQGIVRFRDRRKGIYDEINSMRILRLANAPVRQLFKAIHGEQAEPGWEDLIIPTRGVLCSLYLNHRGSGGNARVIQTSCPYELPAAVDVYATLEREFGIPAWPNRPKQNAQAKPGRIHATSRERRPQEKRKLG